MSTISDVITTLRDLAHAITRHLAWLPPTLARLTVGWIFLWSGWGKLHNLPAVIEFFDSLGIPAPQLQAPFAAGTELVCGVLVLVGLGTRLASIPLMITMVVALLTAQRESLTGLNAIFGLIEYLYITLLLWLAIDGPGPLSLDRLIAHNRAPHGAKQRAASGPHGFARSMV